ncbi:glycosyltransferase family 2 protein [Methylophaga sp.]|uniref:glycosyltransferase family 2 protein n=1 Tax=Methylophaga sp. TaxID=2024840 RepID=UPI003A8FFB53
MLPLVTIITPVFNGANLLRYTLDSIVKQSYKNIEYIIVDGGSTDETLDIVNEYSDIVSKIISEKDSGMYDALAKGLLVANGEVICYLNAGDVFYEKAIEVVANIFSDNNLSWVTGYRSTCIADNIIVRIDLPFRYKSNLIEKCAYGRWLPYIQQESTFWKRELIETIDLEKLRSLKLAGDYYLWYCFSHQATLEIVKTPLGIFRIHEGQLSENLESYWKEIKSFSSKMNLYDFVQVIIEAFFWLLDSRVRDKLFNNIWKFNLKKNLWERGSK